MARGRKSKYKTHVEPHLAWVNEQIRNGVIEEEIAKALNISVTTLNNYRRQYPEFAEALNKGKGSEVLQKLINCGIEAACGQWIEEETTIIQLDEEGAPVKRQKQINKKYIPPSPQLHMFYTKFYGKEKGFTADPLELELKRARLDFDKAIQSEKDFKKYE